MNDSNARPCGWLNPDVSTEQSVVLRYAPAFVPEGDEPEHYTHWVGRTSIREGARIFDLCTYKGVSISIMDESSLMHTRTLKSIDGCVSIAKCLAAGHERIVFESGGNTGMALAAYGQRAGVETFCFVPESNLPYLNGAIWEAPNAHLISVRDPGNVKRAAHLFAERNGIVRVPRKEWRYAASRYRGLFILEHMLEVGGFDWISQTISAAFGPIGIYWALARFGTDLPALPRFLGVQQAANCPMYRAWKSQGRDLRPDNVRSTSELLARVMYDVRPHTYGTYEDLVDLLERTGGDLTVVDKDAFGRIVARPLSRRPLLDHLSDNAVQVTVRDDEIVEKTGLIALVGTLAEIDGGRIAEGERVLCCLTSAVSNADGRAIPSFSVDQVDDNVITHCTATLLR